MLFPCINYHLSTISVALIDDFHHIVHLNETNRLKTDNRKCLIESF
jgi:hypothetical protein